MQILIYLAILVVSTVLTVLLAPKPPKPKPSSLDDFDVPTADESRDIPWVFGTVTITGPNVVWYGDLAVKAIKKKKGGVFGIGKKKVTLGYRYFMGLHFALCYGPVDSLRRVVYGEREAFRGSVTDTSQIFINKPQLFGSDQGDGGLVSYVDVLMGKPDQGNTDGYLFNQLGPDIPSFRGVLSAVFQKAYIGNSPFVKPAAFEVQRIIADWAGGVTWYPATAAIPLSAGSAPGEALVLLAPDATEVRWLEVPLNDLTDYSAVGFDDSAWSVGPIPFGSGETRGDAAAYQFPATAGTSWTGSSGIWGRVTVPVADPTGQRLAAVIDNYVTLYVNGTEVANVGQDTGIGFFEYDVTPLLVTGDNLIAFRARNTGGPSYVSVRMQRASAGTLTDFNAMNPAHIVYQCLTDPLRGMGYPVETIDDASFTAAADTLFAEGLGLCMQWVNADSIQNFVQEVLDHAGAILYADPTTGLFALKLIRDDYDPAMLPVFDESNLIAVESFQRPGYGETVNEVTVVYRDFVTNKDTPVTVQNLANIAAQGGVVSQSQQYPGLPTADLALRLAQRDLISRSTPLAKATLRVNREAWALIPGDVIKLSWAKLGLTQVVCRVLDVNAGTLTDGALTVQVAEDVFGLPANSYAVQQDSQFTAPITAGQSIALRDVLEASYYEVASTAGESLASFDPATGVVQTVAAGGSDTSLGYLLHSRTGSSEYEQQDEGSYLPTATLTAALTQSGTVLAVGSVDLTDVALGSLVLIGSGATSEWAQLMSKSPVTVARAVADTTPRAWPLGTRVWFTDDGLGTDPTRWATGTAVEVKLTDNATGGESQLAQAAALPITLNSRFARPYPPGRVLVNGEPYPTTISTALNVTWAHRDRVAQAATLVPQTADSIGPESGTTYSAYLYDDGTDALLETLTGITAELWEPALTGTYRLRLELESVRAGYTSWQRQVRIFGFDTEGANRLTEPGAARLTEGGEGRATE